MFAGVYQPHKGVAVDEAMIKFQGRSSLKQYMPMKPIKRGIKVWMLLDSKTGYFSKFDIYCGKGTSPEKQLGARVVKTLTEPLKGKFHHIFFWQLLHKRRIADRSEGWSVCLWDSEKGLSRISRVIEECQAEGKAQNIKHCYNIFSHIEGSGSIARWSLPWLPTANQQIVEQYSEVPNMAQASQCHALNPSSSTTPPWEE